MNEAAEHHTDAKLMDPPIEPQAHLFDRESSDSASRRFIIEHTGQ